MIDQSDFGFDDGGPDHERLRAHGADFTPEPVVEQGIRWVKENLGPPRSLEMFDPCAGAGVFGKVMKRVFPDARTFGCEIREEEERYVQHWYDDSMMGSFKEFVAGDGALFDLVVTNPDFSLFVDALETGMRVVRPGGWVMLLGLNELGTRGEKSREAWDKWMPNMQLRIAGTIGFRGPGLNPETGKRWGTDQRSYSWWLWRRRRSSAFKRMPFWRTCDLPLLEAHERTWRVRPGTEGVDD